MYNGGETTLMGENGFLFLPSEEQKQIYEFVRDLPKCLEVHAGNKDFVLVHAGIENFNRGIDLGSISTAPVVYYRPTPETEYYDDKYVVFGHTPTRNLRMDDKRKGIKDVTKFSTSDDIYHRGMLIGIDCACVYGGKLGCLCLDTMDEFYVKPKSHR